MIHFHAAHNGYTIVTLSYLGEQYVVMCNEEQRKTVGADLHIADGMRLRDWIQQKGDSYGQVEA